MGLLSYIPLVGPLVEMVVKEVSDWSERRDTLRSVRLEAEVAEIRARTEIAAYKVKSDIEWDLKWAGQAEASWKDEWLLILWSVPLIMAFVSIIVPPLRDDLLVTLEFLNGLNDQLLVWYAGGWALIFGATFGYRGFVQMMVPGKVAKIAEAFSQLPDDVPHHAVDEAQEAIRNAY